MTSPASVQRVGVAFPNMKPAEQISELFYKHAVEVTKPAYLAINRAYTMEARKENPKTEYRFQEAHRQAKQHLNFHKKAVRDFVDTFVLAKKHKATYDASQDAATTQLRQILDTQLLTLHNRLIDYAPMLVPEDDVDSCRAVLRDRFESERKELTHDISFYEADPKVKPEDY